MDLILDGNGPAYLQVVRALKEAVVTGRLADGTRLPSTRDLAIDLKVSRTTVVAAYEHLRAEGFLVGKVGSGSYVCTSARLGDRPRPFTRAQPQSTYARRLRENPSITDPPGRRPPGMRFAFQYGMPSVSTTLTSQWTRQLAKVAPYVRPEYPSPGGLPGLRDVIARHVARTRGVFCTPDDIVIVSGTTQALALLSRVLLDEGDMVALEDPHWLGARFAFQLAGADIEGVPVDDDGMRTDLLPDRPARVVYVTPSHQFPTGSVLSHERRVQLLDYARAAQGWVIEDDYDGEFRHGHRAVESLQSLDRDGRVIYIGSFSKTLFPALRLGYVVAPPALRDDLLAAKYACDSGSPPLEQAVLEEFIRSHAFERHLKYITLKLAERRGVLRAALTTALGSAVEVLDSHSGMYFMAWLDRLSAGDGDALVKAAADRQLAVFPATRCYLAPPDRLGLIMGFSTIAMKDIPLAVDVLADAIASVERKLERHAPRRPLP
jgi:GntR family transcriptional regulator/MocR family aminotransferase